MSTLYLEFWSEGEDFHLYAKAAEEVKEFTLAGRAAEIVAHFATIYTILENKQEERTNDLQAAIRILSELLIRPFAGMLQRSSLVRFVVDESLVRCAFDLLSYEGKPLFLQRNLCYQVEEGTGEDEPHITLESALLIADLSADPEEACKEVSRLIPQAQYVEIAAADLSTIRACADQIDVLVVSAHGELDDDNWGRVTINDESIGPKLIGKLEAWIVYFDSCQQGANLGFLQAFQNDSNTQFYLAPILSNDAGDSSTKTMLWFFKAVLEHGNPIRALAETRKRLFEFYTARQKLSLITSLNKAFAFRIYEFVGDE